MRHRLALIVGSIVASGTLAVALAAAGFGPVSPSLDSAAVSITPAPSVQVDTVYLPPPATPPTITVHRTVVSSGEGDDGEAGGDD